MIPVLYKATVDSREAGFAACGARLEAFKLVEGEDASPLLLHTSALVGSVSRSEQRRGGSGCEQYIETPSTRRLGVHS